MAVKIRLARRGRKKLAIYDMVVADARAPRDGKFIEKLGVYNPMTNPATITLNVDKALDWLLKGAQPTNTARRILSHKGVMLRKHLQVGVLKGAITQEEADKRYEEWLKGKEAQIASKIDSLTKEKADKEKARLEAERKINEAKAEALRQKMAVQEPEVEEAPAEEAETPAEEAAVETTEAPAEEKVEETPAEEVKEEAPIEEAKEGPAAVKEAATAEEAAPEVEKAEEKKEEPKAEAEEEKKEEPAAEKQEEKKEEEAGESEEKKEE